jgi:hypothetical protein
MLLSDNFIPLRFLNFYFRNDNVLGAQVPRRLLLLIGTALCLHVSAALLRDDEAGVAARSGAYNL